MKKLIIVAVSMIIGILWIGYNFVYAADEAQPTCDACTTTSPYIDTYIKFAYELIKTFQTYANTNQYTFQKQWDNNITQWQWQTKYDPDFQRELQSIVDDLNKKAQTTASTVYVSSLIWLETVFADSWKNMSVALHNKALMRDWQKLDAVWQSINNTLIDLWNAGVFEKLGFRDWWEARIQDIFTRYSQWDSAPIAIQGTEWRFQPRDVLWALRRMNQSLKTTISIGNGFIDNTTDNTFLNGVVTFSPWLEIGLPEYYSCARWTKWLQCNPSGRMAKENLKSIWKDTKNQTKDAKTTIQNALKRLSWFWSKNDKTKDSAREMLKQRERELMRSEYWLAWVRATQSGSVWWVQTAIDSRKTLKEDTASIWPFAWLKKVNDPTKQWEEFVVGSIIDRKIQRDNKLVLEQAFYWTLDSAQKWRKETKYADSSDITKIFPSLSRQISSAKDKIDWTKANALVQNLWKACEAQCSNTPWKCRY